MNNLMKAEWFRLRHSGSSLWLVLFCGITALAMQFIGDSSFSFDMVNFSTHSSLAILISAIGSVAAVSVTFNSRLVHYELMKGTPPMQTILSKTLISLMLVTVTYYLPTVILLAVFDGAHMSVSMAILFYVCIIKVTAVFQACCIIFKDYAALAPIFFAFIFETVPLVLLQNVAGLNVEPLAPWFLGPQLMAIGDLSMIDMDELSMPLDASYIGLKIVISTVVLAALFMALAHRSLKNKWQVHFITGE